MVEPRGRVISIDRSSEESWDAYREYDDQVIKSRGYEVSSLLGRKMPTGVVPLLEGEMEDSERKKMAEFAIREHNKELPIEEHHNLVDVKRVTHLWHSYYDRYYFTMMVKDSTGKDNSCRAKILRCLVGCKFLEEYGLGPFVDGTTMLPELFFCSRHIAKPQSTSQEKIQKEESDGPMKLYNIEKCDHLKFK